MSSGFIINVFRIFVTFLNYREDVKGKSNGENFYDEKNIEW